MVYYRKPTGGWRGEVIDFNPIDKNVDVHEIERLMEIYDKNGVFATRTRYHKNFYSHFIRLISNGNVMTFRDTRKGFLKGFCSWIIVDRGRFFKKNVKGGVLCPTAA